MPSNSNNNNNNNEFNFIDETGKTKEKHKNQRRMALLNIHKTKLRKQLQNNNLLVNYFEWDHDACQTNNSGQLEQKQQNNIKRLQVPNMYQYSLSNFTNENLPLVTKKQHVLEVNNTSIRQLNHHSKNKRIDSNSGNNNSTLQTGKREEETKMKRKILISEEFGLKLDLEDFIQSLKEYGLH
ncbi:hypothetical protein ABK040_012533 [Willaertia magna]